MDGAPDGTLSLALPPLSALLLRADRDIPVSPPARPSLAVARDNLSNLVRASVGAPRSPVIVSFAVRRAKGKAWERLGVDDSPPYRAFLDPARYGRGERVWIVAIARARDGATATSKLVPFTPRR